LKAAKPHRTEIPRPYLIDRPTGTTFFSAGEVAAWTEEQPKARGFKSSLLDRFLKTAKP
jgi:hypothetical protein